MPSQIRIGCRVSAAVGPYIPRAEGSKRRSRSRYHGVVIRYFAEKQWTVYEEVKKALKFERKAPAEGLAGLDLESILNDNYAKDLKGLDRAWATTLGRQDHRGSQEAPAAASTGRTTAEIACPPVVADATVIVATIPPPPMARTTQTITNNDHDIPPTATDVATTSVSAPTTLPATTTAPVETQDVDPNSLLLGNANNQDPNPPPSPVDPSERDKQDPDSVLDEDPYDPQSVLEDF
jgi:hypothetical protein